MWAEYCPYHVDGAIKSDNAGFNYLLEADFAIELLEAWRKWSVTWDDRFAKRKDVVA
jgi:hypothetical protein